MVGAGNRANDSTPGNITNYTTTSINGLATSAHNHYHSSGLPDFIRRGDGTGRPWRLGILERQVAPFNNWTAITMALRAASAAAVETVDQGAITLTGQSVSQVDIIPVTAGTLSFAGDEVGLLGGDRITIENADTVLAGQSVTVTQPRI